MPSAGCRHLRFAAALSPVMVGVMFLYQNLRQNHHMTDVAQIERELLGLPPAERERLALTACKAEHELFGHPLNNVVRCKLRGVCRGLLVGRAQLRVSRPNESANAEKSSRFAGID